MNESEPILRYANRDPEAEAAQRSPSERVMNGLTWAILIVCLSVWAVIGAIVWIPLLVRTMVRFSAALVPAMLADRKPVRSAHMLRQAVSFYRRGFQVATEVVTREPDPGERKFADEPVLRGKALLNELAWVALIWYAILLLLGVVETTPIDLWWRLVALDWSETVFRPITEFFRGLIA